MARVKLKQHDGGAVDPALLDTFRQDFQGQIILPDEADYEQARQIWNASIDRHPGMIARCLGTADIMQAVTFARENKLLVSVRGGGHNVAGRTLCDDGVVIDLSLMKGVHVDRAARELLAQGGGLARALLAGLGQLLGQRLVAGLAQQRLGRLFLFLAQYPGEVVDSLARFPVVLRDIAHGASSQCAVDAGTIRE